MQIFEAITGFVQANALWAVTCIVFVAVIMISVNVVARRSADRWREVEEACKDFEELESFSTLYRVQQSGNHHD